MYSIIKIPYTVTADIAKYEGEVFNKTPNLNYIKQKQTELNQSGYTLPDALPLVKSLSEYCGFKETDDIKEIALQLEEDIAVLHNGKLVSICFCFPSGFDPSEKVGMNFFEIHVPVADNEKLQRASSKVVEIMSKPGALYRRYVWTLTTSPKLSRHPSYRQTEPPVTTIDNLYFRKETQTTVGHTDGKTTFFFVKVDVIPFKELPLEIQQQAIDSLKTMSDATIEYKGLNNIKKLF